MELEPCDRDEAHGHDGRPARLTPVTPSRRRRGADQGAVPALPASAAPRSFRSSSCGNIPPAERWLALREEWLSPLPLCNAGDPDRAQREPRGVRRERRVGVGKKGGGGDEPAGCPSHIWY